MVRVSLVASLVVVATGTALADPSQRCVDVEFVPADRMQMVAWVEDAAGNYIDTLYITQQTGSFGLGNRPGRFDFNAGPNWPYGRRTTVLPVWAHHHGKTFPTVIFQNCCKQQDLVTDTDDPDVCLTETGSAYQECAENNLSHPFADSSRENHYCRPMMKGEPGWDAMTCASTAFTDKGKFSTTSTTLYPPRADVMRSATDSPSVAMYKMINPFDAVSQATPLAGDTAHATWPAPGTLPTGDYVLWIEVAKESDMNATYNPTAFPSPAGIPWTEYGVAYRGQPSIVYRVPFTLATTETSATAASYAGYGDPTGADGTVRPPDATITTDTPGSGGSRLALISDGSASYRVRVDVRPDVNFEPPGVPDGLAPVTIGGSTVTMQFVAPAVGQSGKVTGYEIRIRANDEMTPDNFAMSMPVTASVLPTDPGLVQSFELDGLLPETDYWVGIRAYDGCHNLGSLAIVKVTTASRVSGTVDACFVATAAYGSVMANDVELLRHFRDTLLESTVLGELAVESYYTFGPAVAGVVGESDLLRQTARDLLAPIIQRVRGMSF